MKGRGPVAAVVIALVVLGLGAAWSAQAGQPGGEPERADPRPNIIVIVTDDGDERLFFRKLMPATFGLLEQGGTRLRNLNAVTPLCCPSRATQLTGQYGHNNGVLSNDPGYPAMSEPRNVLPAWLQAAGYQTAQVGRFLNGYRRAATVPAEPAPGWDRWIGLLNLHYRNFDLSIDGRREHVGGLSARNYVTRVLHRWTNKLIRQLHAESEPFYMQIDELAPHSDHLAEGSCAKSALPGPNLLRPVRSLKLRALSHLEKNVSDKPSFIRKRPPLNDEALKGIQQRMRCRAASLREVDRGIARMIRQLRRLGEFDDTVILVYSDNGYFSGEHRMTKSKGLPYEEAVRVPGLLRVPADQLGATAPHRLDVPAANIDIVPTILDLAGADPCVTPGHCRVLDGHSLLPALRDPSDWPEDRELLLEVDQAGRVAGGTVACTWSGIKSGNDVYVEYKRVILPGSRRCKHRSSAEHYRLDRDPQERRNLWPPANAQDAADQAELEDELDRLRDCRGTEEAPAPGGLATPCP